LVGIVMLALALVGGLAVSAMQASASAPPATPQGAAAFAGKPPSDRAAADTPTETPSETPSNTLTPTITPSNTRTQTPTVTNTPTEIPTCGTGSDYVIGQVTGASLVPGISDIGNHCDDCTTVISMPFAFSLYGFLYNSAVVGSNGTLGFAGNQNTFQNTCLPNSVYNWVILPHWDDLRTDGTGNYGIFTSVSGSDPNMIFNVEWRACLYSGSGCGGDVTFEVRLYQNQERFDIVYGVVTNAGSSATVGVQRDNGFTWTQYECETGGLTPGLQLIFQPIPCGGPTFTPSSTPQRTATPTPPSGCGTASDYIITEGTAVIISGTDLVPGSQCDDCTVSIPLPFTYSLYGVPFAGVFASSNGNLQFTSNNNAFTNACLPATSMNDLIAPHWDDLYLADATLGEGIYTTATGIAPDRVFAIHWRGEYYDTPGLLLDFEVLLYENQTKFDIIYGAVPDGGISATVGVQRGTGPQRSQFACNVPNILSTGLRLTFAQPVCPTSTVTRTPTNTPTSTSTPGAGLIVGHVTWQNIPQNNARSILPITLTLKLGTSSEVNYPQQNTDAAGFFTAPVGSLAPGTYSWRVQAPDGVNGGNTGPGFLANCGSIVLAGAPQTNIEMGQMKGGDATNDNVINTTDFNILKLDFGQGGVRRADFDNNLVVNSTDFNLQKGNFGQAGCNRILAPGEGK
jgi:hypothetical protein